MANLRDLVGKRVRRTAPVVTKKNIVDIFNLYGSTRTVEDIDRSYMDVTENSPIVEKIINDVPVLLFTHGISQSRYKKAVFSLLDDDNWEDCTEVWGYCYGEHEESSDC